MIPKNLFQTYYCEYKDLPSYVKNCTETWQEFNPDFNYIALVAFTVSFISSYLTIKYFLSFISRFNLDIFVYYRIVIGITILLFI